MADAQFTGLVVRIKGDMGDYSNTLTRMDADTVKTSQRVLAALNNIGAASVFKGGLGVAGAITGIQGVTSALSDAVEAGIKFDSTMEQSEIAFGSMMKDVEGGKRLLDDLWSLAATTPFEFPELQEGAKKLLAFGFAAQDIVPILTTIGDTASAMGMSGAEGIGRITKALGQMQAKSKVSGDEMLQLTEAGIPAWDILAKAMGKTTAEVMKLSEKGLIPADKAIAALIDGMNSRFGGMMEKQSKTFQGQMSNMADIASSTVGAVIKPAFDDLAQNTLPAVNEKLSEIQATMKSGGYDALARSILPDEVVTTTETGLRAIGTAAGFAKDNILVLGETTALVYAGLNAETIFTATATGLRAIAVAAGLATISFAGLAAAAGAGFAFVLANPVVLAVAAAGAGLVWLTQKVQEWGQEQLKADGIVMEGADAMDYGVTAAYNSVASAAEKSAARVVSASRDAYIAMYSLVQEAKALEEQGVGIAGGKATAGWKSIPKAPPQLTIGSGGKSIADISLPDKAKGHQQTEYEKYKADTQDLLSMWEQQVSLEKISKEQFSENVQERLDGLAKVNVLQKEQTDKQRLEYELTGKIMEIGRQQRQDIIELYSQKLQLGQITLKQYVDEVQKQAKLATTEKERMSLAIQAAQARQKLLDKELEQIDLLLVRKQAALALLEENERHNMEMIKIYSDSSYETQTRNIKAETDLALKNLRNRYNAKKASLEEEINLYKTQNGQLTEQEQKTYKKLLNDRTTLDEQYQQNRIELENQYTEKIAAKQKAIIDANNDMIASVIAGTKSGHDILEDMWEEFVRKIVEKNLSISSSMNIFEAILGPLFGLKTTSGISASEMAEIDNVASYIAPTLAGARAGGGDVEAGKAYLTSELGPEIFIPKTAGTIISNNQLKGLMSNNAAPKVSVTVVNNTGVEADVKASQPKFDGETWVSEVILNKVAGSPVYARNFKDALGVT